MESFGFVTGGDQGASEGASGSSWSVGGLKCHCLELAVALANECGEGTGAVCDASRK